jgi:hypothetical protein
MMPLMAFVTLMKRKVVQWTDLHLLEVTSKPRPGTKRL